MEKVFFTLLLFALVKTDTLFRLSTADPKQLKVGDKLISTLGHFTATLQSKQCTLLVQMFNEDSLQYQQKGKFKSSLSTTNCNHLQVAEGKVLTDTGNNYMEVSSESFNESTIFTIDDEGVIRLVGTYVKLNRVDYVSAETNYTDFRVQQPYFRAFSNLKVDFMTRVSAVSNKRKWKFIAEFGQLTIYFAENPAHKVDYVYSSITIRNSKLFDFSDETFPGILYNNITFSPRCFQPRLYLNFKIPFVFAIDPYWPTLRVYEQGRYQIIDISYGKLTDFDFQPGYSSFYFAKGYSPCPLRTFEYRGDCVASCPAPYYHEMRGQIGRCVLNCEEETPKDEKKRICECFSSYQKQKLNAETIKKCPSTATPTPYGCYCKNQGEFYDQKYTFDCVKGNKYDKVECPERTYAHNGMCMDCPTNCKTCQEDNFYRNFLECQQCIAGFKVYKGQCVKECINNYGLSIYNGECMKCQDKNCINCENDPNVCLQCNIMNTLQNGECKSSCSDASAKPVYSQLFSTQCVVPSEIGCIQMLASHYKSKPFLKCDMCMTGISHLDKCVTECPSGYYAHNDKYCACAGIKNITIGDECIDLPGCPITMSFDIRSHSCLSCPFGCMSCINTQCTSCNPGYFLYISPQSILCRRKSPLFPCDKQYELVRGICRVKDFTNARLQMNLCSTLIPNCEVCIPRSIQICVMCAQNYKIFNNTCVDTCPEGLIPYQNTCVLSEIQNCAITHFSSLRQNTILNIKLMEQSHAYRHYIYSNREPANDPIGYIPYFQKLTTQKSDGVPRQTDFFQPQEICLKCNDGLGMSDNFKQCLPCPSPCITCYLAKNYSCLTVKGGGGGGGGDCLGFIDSETGKCLSSCNDKDKFPEIDEGKLACKQREKVGIKDYGRIDSAIYENRDGTSLVFFVFGDKLSLSDDENKTINIIVEKGSSSRFLQDAIDAQLLEIQEDSYISIQNSTSQIYILNMTGQLINLKSQNNLLFPNQVYGTTNNNTHVQFVQTWLAYIGYIMSIVILILHIVFIGNELLYKVDNLLIFVQSVFYFSFVKNLAGRLLGQFYFGWSFAHARFLPNLFDSAIPDHYYEQKAPPSFKLLNIDGNYFRNAGFSLGWLLIFIAIFILCTLLVWALLYKKNGRKEIWYPKVARQALIAGFQFFTMNIMFFSITQLLYSGGGEQKNKQFFDSSQGLAITSIILILIYSGLRIVVNALGGIYMLKRVILAIVLAPAYENYLFIIPVLITQVIFSIARFFIESPETKLEILGMFGESVSFSICYLLLFLVMDAGVNTIFISVFVFAFIVYLAYDLTTIYLESRNEYLIEEVEETHSEQAIKASKINANRYGSKIEGSRQGSKIIPSRLENGSRLDIGDRNENTKYSAISPDNFE